LTIVSFCGIILAQELVLLSMIVGATQLYHRRTFSCSLFVTHVLYLNTITVFMVIFTRRNDIILEPH
ncbi:MAG: hypothetical protein SO122_01060, partial [Eubacteriales bacterium]|nr:hypothetical protein [Eubacteriales bacterium]